MALYLGDLELATGGGATGTGLPVNTYESFLVNSTGNPTGYNATTGLYTHPNGDYWLKTGNTISNVASTYPDATLIPAIGPTTMTYTGVSFGLNPPANPIESKGIDYDGTNHYYQGDYVSQPARVYQKDLTGAYTGVNYAAMGGSGVTWDGTNFYTVNQGTTISQFDAAGVSTGFNISTAAEMPSGICRGIKEYNGILYVATQFGTANIPGVYAYDKVTGAYTGFKFNVNGQTTIPYDVTYDGTSFYIINGTSVWQYSNLGVFTLLFSASAGGGKGVSVSSDGTKLFTAGASGFFEYAMTNPTPAAVGDSTARTDTDSGQPLFIKLK